MVELDDSSRLSEHQSNPNNIEVSLDTIEFNNMEHYFNLNLTKAINNRI